jgi:hypothetical protein
MAYADHAPKGSKQFLDLLSRRRFTGILLIALLQGCGVHQKTEVPTSPPFATCRIETFGWSKALGLGQEVWVELEPGAHLASVVDLSIFGPLKPGGNDQDALRVAGKPSRVETDRWGEPWLVYERPAATLKVGCGYESSGPTPEGCSWRLLADIKPNRERSLLHPEILRFMGRAQELSRKAKSRTVHVQTSGNEEFVSYTFEGPARGQLLWHDNRKNVWRPGKPKR